MASYVLRRVSQAVPIAVLTSLVVFLMLHLAPGDPVVIILSAKPQAYTQEEFDRVEKSLGLDKPLAVQYVTWLGDVVRGDFGESFYLRREIRGLLVQRMEATLFLAFGALIFSLPVGILGGVVSSMKRGSILDRTINAVVVAGVAVPTFALGLFLIVLFGLKIELLPVGGMTSFGDGGVVDRLRHLVLPAISLGVGPAAIIARLTRSAMLEVLNQDYVRTARAKGLRNAIVVRRHAFRNVLIPVITVIGLQVGFLLGGAVLVEVVFSWPGMGQMIVNGIQQRDFPVVQAGVLVVSLAFIVTNLVVDVLYAVVDPRIRHSR
ncbi:MAG: peptide/nickel transport system permease protein [Thermomicrobiales bacterium]|nr:peptide/nickel transport system permease protein [Thermomicrobiales bacterium]MEA2585683.1 peptide/nickel transport system permease protein [Thermomicrobiales bacterium]